MKPPFSPHLLIVVVLISISFSCKRKDKKIFEEHGPQFKIETGPMIEAASKDISPGGGEIIIEEAGHELNGFHLAVPNSAYAQDLSFTISSATISKKDLGNNMQAISPLISIDNGGEYSEFPMEVSIPLNEPKGKLAMAYIYDEETGRLEGLPTVAAEDNQITVLTSHFSKIVALYNVDAGTDLFLKDYETQFKPGVDDWQMGNPGKIKNAATGQCSGESMAMLWYFREKRLKAKEPPLNGRFDGEESNKTPDFWQDDVNAVKFCAILQAKVKKFRLAPHNDQIRAYVRTQRIRSDEETMQDFANAFIAEPLCPKYISVSNAAGEGHAMVVYKMSQGTLFIADPNYPGSLMEDGKYPGMNRKIVYDINTKTYQHYTSGKHTFTNFTFLGESAILAFNSIEILWPNLLDGKFLPKYFPEYAYVHVGEDGKLGRFFPGYRGYTAPSDGILRVFPANPLSGGLFNFNVYDVNRRPVNILEPLAPGIHKLGFSVYDDNSEWIGFDWMEVLVPERRIMEDQPHFYHGHDFSMIVTLDGRTIEIDSIDFKITEGYPSGLTAYDKTGPNDEHLFSFLVNKWAGVGNYSDVIGQYVVGENSADTYYEGKAIVQITQWGGGILAGNFSFEADNIDNKRVNVTGSFRFPK